MWYDTSIIGRGGSSSGWDFVRGAGPLTIRNEAAEAPLMMSLKLDDMELASEAMTRKEEALAKKRVASKK